ncbi:ATP-binding protein [Rubinisphaera italica]|uniref:Riboflavin biosynthesis protein RibD n=1 Tax=Rubinisphaera italica TaxID=2527969 RepID=A0A5C5XF50_9PLAN|nr:ATP-binding protein [Rubinisphaera italica]TWT61716.1 Riboflavin biosynthesis protein RibD [Rubinisphaera italica]
MPKFNPRTMMELAIDYMRLSIAETREDGKASPKVGAVLVNVGEEVPSSPRISTAYRGELREGDHAEFTLLERKNRDKKLDDCVLFATLEPCAPNSRNHPKLGCAERIVLARIKEVWVGVADPDPKVDRKGIKYLQDNGVNVHMFDQDLQKIILEENKEFFDQALERAAAAEEEPPTAVILSPLESASPSGLVSDFSDKAMESYLKHSQIDESPGSSELNRRLMLQGLLQYEEGKYKPTGFGLILFGKQPRISMPQSGLLATIHYSNGTEEIFDFEGPQVLVPNQAMQWLKDKLPNVISRSNASRLEKNDLFFELVREGIVNALVHRDYSIEGAKCQLRVFPEKFEILSPGKPVTPITIEQLQSFDAPMLSRNPVLHYVFAKMKLAEERGFGLRSMKNRSNELGLPLPKYTWTDPYLKLTLFPSQEGTVSTLPSTILEQLSSSEREGWKWLSTQGVANTPEYSKAMGVENRTGRRHLQHFVELGLASVNGSGRATRYEVN